MKNTTKQPQNLEQLSRDELLLLIASQQNIINESNKEITEAKKELALTSKEVVQVREKLEEANKEIGYLKEIISLFNKHKYGSKADQNPAFLGQLNLFDEVEFINEENVSEVEVKAHKKRKKHQSMDFTGLKEVHFNHTVEYCDVCESPVKSMGEEIVKLLVYVPASYYVEVHHYPKYLCENCSEEETSYIFTAPKEQKLLAKSVATPSLIAGVIHDKFVMSIPLYRQELELKRKKIPLSRQTLSNWLLSCDEQYFTPMIEVMKEEAQTLSSVHVDETTIQVLDEKATKNQYMWVVMSGKWEEKQMILYHYHKNRNHAFAKEILSTSHEYVHSDAYGAYEKVENITNVFCLAHARRYLLEALEVNEGYTILKKLSKEKQKEYIEDHPGFKHLYEIYIMIQKIFSLEKEYRRQGYTPEKIYQHRQEEQKGLLGELFICISKSKGDYGVKSKAGKAIHYLYNHFNHLTNYMLDGRLECSNNRIEGIGIRSFTVGRKNWLFANTTRGAHSSAIIYSIVESAKLNGLDVFKYLTYVLECLKEDTSKETIQKLLPYTEEMKEKFKK